MRQAMQLGSSWPDAVVAAERAAFPVQEQFVALCMAHDDAVAEFVRADGRYSVVQKGLLSSGAPYVSPVQSSDERFPERGSWETAVKSLGPRLGCDALTVIYPTTDATRVTLSEQGRVAGVAER